MICNKCSVFWPVATREGLLSRRCAECVILFSFAQDRLGSMFAFRIRIVVERPIWVP